MKKEAETEEEEEEEKEEETNCKITKGKGEKKRKRKGVQVETRVHASDFPGRVPESSQSHHRFRITLSHLAVSKRTTTWDPSLITSDPARGGKMIVTPFHSPEPSFGWGHH